MAFRDFISKYFSNHAETRDNHNEEDLQTHYYKTTKDRVMKRLGETFENDDTFKVKSVSETHGEIGLIKKKGRKVFIVVTVIMVRPMHTAIDFAVTTESILPFDFGYSTKIVHQLNARMAKEFTLISKKRN